MLCSISATSRRARSSSSCSGCTEDDLAGHVLRQGGWEAASFPAIAEEDETHVMEAPFGRTRTFRRATGEALNEEREPLATLAEIRATIGEYNFAAQYQQRYCRVEEGRGGLRLGQSPRFPFPAHQTGRADFPHPAFRQTSWQAHGVGLSGLNELGHAVFSVDFAPGKPARASPGLLVSFGEEAANALADMVIDGPIGRRAGSIAEVRRPARQQAVQSVAHARPRALLAWLQEIADLVLDALHAFPGRTRAQVFLSDSERTSAPACSRESRSFPLWRSSPRSWPR